MINSVRGMATSGFSDGALFVDVGYRDDTVTICAVGGAAKPSRFRWLRRGRRPERTELRVELMRTDVHVFALRLAEECQPQPEWRRGETAKRAAEDGYFERLEARHPVLARIAEDVAASEGP